MGQSRISTHLAQLRREGLVKDRRVGKNIIYTLSIEETAMEEAVRELLRVCVAEIPEWKNDRAALRLIRSKRQDKAREYFNRLAGKFGKSYCPGRSWQALSHLLLDLLPPMVIADLGAGEGSVSQLLARRAIKVIAVDNSEKMVEFGTRLALENEVHNLEYRLGDLENPPIEPNSVDLAILSQALHHAVHPPTAIAAAYRLLKPGGRLMVLDLLSHQFEPAKEMYADLWLGFSEVELFQMCEQAGFTEVDVGVVSRDSEPPNLHTILARGFKPLG